MNYNVDMTIRRKYKIPVWISVNILIILTVDFNFNYNQLSSSCDQDMGVEKKFSCKLSLLDCHPRLTKFQGKR